MYISVFDFFHFNPLIQLPSPFVYIKLIIAISLFAFGFYLFRQGNKLDEEYIKNTKKLTDISKPVGIAFGIIALLCVPFIFIFSIMLFAGSLFVDERLSLEMQWLMVIAPVIFTVASIGLAVAGLRLIKARKSSKERLFSPYWVWPRISGILFLIIAVSRFFHKNIQGVWVVL